MYLFENPNNDASVVYDETTLTNEEKSRGIQISELPVPEVPNGKMPILKCRKETGQVWYEYENTLTDTTEQRIADLEIAMATILGGAL